jgi:hypothetical protein
MIVAQARQRFRAIALFALTAGCSSVDIVAVRVDQVPFDEQDSSASTINTSDGSSSGPGNSDKKTALPEEFQLVGRPLANWPFPIVTWPLTTSLAETFGDGRGQGPVVRLTGADAQALQPLWQQLQAGELGPSRSEVGVRDASGDEYLITLKAR